MVGLNRRPDTTMSEDERKENMRSFAVTADPLLIASVTQCMSHSRIRKCLYFSRKNPQNKIRRNL